MPSPLAALHKLRPPADHGTLGLYARTRDPLLLAELVRRHGPLVWGVCRRALPHPADAEDAYQATWLVLARNPGAVRTPAALPAFLHTVAVRACRRVRQKRPVTGPADHLPGRDPPAADALTAREYLHALDDELARLPDKLRRPLVLCFLDGHTQDEAAAALGVSVSTLKRRLEAGKAVLRARLAGRGVDLAAALAAAGLMGVGAPAVIAGGAGAVATAISTEVLTAMWMLKAKGWAAGLVLAAGLTAAGGGLLVADDRAKPGAGPGKTLADKPAAVDQPGGPEAGGAVELADDNFRVIAPTPEQAKQIVRAAEAARHMLAVRWLGRELPKWERRCEIRYKPTSGTDVGGTTTLTFTAPGSVVSMRMELTGSYPGVLANALPHEVMHTVLASHFGKPVPRWADEGIAVLTDPESAQHKYAVKTAELLNLGRGIPLRHLFALEEYPKDLHVLYAQGYSVCRFLLGRKPAGGEAALLDFVRRGMADGWEPAAKAVYGFTDLDAMQAEWIVSLRVPQPPVPAPPVPRPVPSSQVLPPPATAPPAPWTAPPPPAKPADPVGAAYDDVIGGLEQAIKAADEAAAAQQTLADQYAQHGGASAQERLNVVNQAARHRESAIQNRVKLAEVRLDRAKFERANPPTAAPTALPQRLLRERIDNARRFIQLDRAIRDEGAISREEASTFQVNLALSMRQLHDAQVAADPIPAGRLAAAREWYVTAKDAELFYKARSGRGLAREQVGLAASLARLEAETALLQAIAAAPPDALNGTAPFAPAPAGYAGKVGGPAANAPGWFSVRPSAGLKPMTALRVSRDGKPVGTLVVVQITPDREVPEEQRNTAGGVLLPNADGTVPEVKVGDEVRP